MLLLLYKDVGFKLISLEVQRHKILGNNKFVFVDENDEYNSIYFSVIIGPNGTGKSELLNVILTLFRIIVLSGASQFNQNISWIFEFKYTLNNNIYTFSNKFIENDFVEKRAKKTRRLKSRPYLLKNDQKIDFWEGFSVLPKSIVANSIMLTDKFLVPRNKKEQEGFSSYKYLGVRYNPQQASTRYYVRKTVEFIVEKFDSQHFIKGIKNLTDFLNFSNSLIIEFRTVNTPKFFKRDIQKNDFDDFFRKIEEKYAKIEKKPPYKLNNYKTLLKKEGTIEALCEFIRNMVINRNNYENIYRSSAKKLTYNILNNDSYSMLNNDYEYLNQLRQLGFIAPPEIKLDLEKDINLNETSSGEFHFFSTMVGLMATVEPNSLVLIEEPEISLHPNWQMRYLEFIRNLFSDPIYQTCHIIIATHSHFLISDMKGKSSKIIGLQKSEGEISTVNLKGIDNTYGWSAEEILYRVFNVTTTRNYYVAAEINELMEELSKKERNFEKIKSKILVLRKLQDTLSDNDPLKTVATKILNRIQKNEL